MKISECSLLLEGLTLADYHVIVITKLPLLESVQQQTTIIDAMVTSIAVSFSHMKN